MTQRYVQWFCRSHFGNCCHKRCGGGLESEPTISIQAGACIHRSQAHRQQGQFSYNGTYVADIRFARWHHEMLWPQDQRSCQDLWQVNKQKIFSPPKKKKKFFLTLTDFCEKCHSCTESVRDVQFSPHQAHHFAAVSENGHVQIWDLRYGGKYLQSFTAHSGPIFACDWHPEMMWLATASRDKTIKVDLGFLPKNS